MNILVKNITVAYPGHDLHGKTIHLLIKEGQVAEISEAVIQDTTAEVIEGSGHYLSPGWLDTKTHFGEPGYEERETMTSGLNAAAHGGFTGVCLMPSLNPVTDNRSTVEYLMRSAAHSPVKVYPIGALSNGAKGEDLANLYDMHKAGAIAFSNDKAAVDNAKYQTILQQYVQGFDGLIYSFPLDKKLTGKGNVNEGVTSTYLGLKGIPHLAEEIVIARDLYITEYTDGKLHFGDISSAGSSRLIEAARAKGLKVTASVAWYHLVFNDEVLKGFDSNYKVLPPIRTEEDRLALITALKEGVIDCISSNHSPLNIELKECEFEHAGYGMAGIQTLYAALNSMVKELDQDTIITALGIRPYDVLGLDRPQLKVGEAANFTIFDPEKEWKLESENNKSLSANNPLMHKTLKGKVVGILNGSLQQFV